MDVNPCCRGLLNRDGTMDRFHWTRRVQNKARLNQMFPKEICRRQLIRAHPLIASDHAISRSGYHAVSFLLFGRGRVVRVPSLGVCVCVRALYLL